MAALVVASCGGGSADTGADPSSSAGSASEVDAPADPTAADAEALINEAIASFDPDRLDAAVADAAALDRAVELEMAEWSGLEAALGGPDATSAAFAAQDPFYAAFAESASAPPSLGFRSAPADGPNIGMGLFGGFMVVGLGSKGIVEVGNSGKTGTATPAKGLTITATAESVEMTVDVTHESNGLTTNLKTHVKIFPCPDVNGEFTVEATVDVSASAGGKQQNGTLDVKVTGQLDDNADLASSSTDIRLKRDGLGMGAFVDSSISYASDGTATTTLNDFNWFTTKPEDFTANIQLAAVYGMLIKHFLLDAVAAGYLSGRCVEIGYGVSPGTTGLRPGSSATITARPRGRQDGVPTGGTVQALLSAGEKSVDPSSTPVPVDAEFEYGAPDEPNKTGTVSLESRSKRGVGRVDINFDTNQAKSYAITGGDPPVDAIACDIDQPFDIVVDYGVARFDFTFSGGLSGTATFTGSGMVTGGGSATYTIVFPDGADQPGTMSIDAGGTFNAAGGTESGSSATTYVVTPIPPCE